MQDIPRRYADTERDVSRSEVFGGEVFEGEIIEGKAIRVDAKRDTP